MKNKIKEAKEQARLSASMFEEIAGEERSKGHVTESELIFFQEKEAENLAIAGKIYLIIGDNDKSESLLGNASSIYEYIATDFYMNDHYGDSKKYYQKSLDMWKSVFPKTNYGRLEYLIELSKEGIKKQNEKMKIVNPKKSKLEKAINFFKKRSKK